MTRRTFVGRAPSLTLAAIASAGLAALMLLGLVAQTPVVGLTPTSFNPKLDALGALEIRDIEDELRFRDEFGISTDRAFVTALAPSPGYPVRMSGPEQADWDRRMRIDEGMGPLLDYGELNHTEFGGLWVDQAAGGVIHMGFTSGIERHRQAALALAPREAEIEVHTTARSLTELDELQAFIDGDVAFQESVGADIQMSMVNTPLNVVTIGVGPLSAESRRALDERYGDDAIEVLHGGRGSTTACTSRSNCIGPPLRGGVSGSYGCSLAYYVVQDGDYRILTAGHCAALFSSWSHAGVALGTMVSRSWAQNKTADAATISGASAASLKSNRVYATGAGYSQLTSSQASSADYVGQAVCLSARMADAVRCGQIRSKDVTITLSGVTLKNQRVASYSYQSGDSGGAVYSATRTSAYGVQSGCLDVTGDGVCDPNWPTYSHIGHIRNELGGPSYIYVYTGG